MLTACCGTRRTAAAAIVWLLKRMGCTWCAQVKRTEGVSTTDIVGRMLTCTRSNPFILGAEVRHVVKS